MHATLENHTDTAPAPKAGTNPPRQIAQYDTPDGARVIHAQRIDGHVRLTDRPQHASGERSYVIERELTSLVELDAVLTDYLQQAGHHGDCPMKVRW